MTTSTRGRLFSAMHVLADEIQAEKQAAVNSKQAEAPTPKDPGGYHGPSTHPTANVDNRGQEASEGARSAENKTDVNEDQGAPGVNKAPDAQAGQQDSVQLNIGTQQSATGEDPAAEDDYKGGKEDPGTSHPAATDNNSLDGHKYASASFDELYKMNGELSNNILADLANGYGGQLTNQSLNKAATDAGLSGGNLNPAATGDNPPAKPKMQSQGEPPEGGDPKSNGHSGKQASQAAATTGAAASLEDMIQKAAAAVQSGKAPENSAAAQNPDLEAGYELAGFLDLEKTAAQQLVGETITATLEDSFKDADLLGSYLVNFQKQAMKDESNGEDHDTDDETGSGASEAAGVSEPAGGDPSGMGGGEGGTLGDLLGGGDPGGMAAGGEMGGEMGGGEMGGGMGGEMGGGLGGEVSEEEALMELAAALEELGIPLEELAQMGAPPAEGMGGPAEGAMPPEEAPPMAEGMKLASAVKKFKRTGKYQAKHAAEGTRSRRLRNEMKNYVLELAGNRR